MTQKFSAERRRHPRLVCHGAGQYRDLLQPNETYAGCITRDVSAGGVGFRTPRRLESDSRLILQLSIPGLSGIVRAIAQVVWAARQPQGDEYEVGAQFVQISPEDRSSVAEYVERGVCSDPRGH
ncbi:MAG: PilZ domain-containing protein [Candidatus Omnitrophica bacterium]|nr:PilZ domain-containing protein [Candidatus Omnitrophota bacterium]